jgi:hypothetical protein
MTIDRFCLVVGNKQRNPLGNARAGNVTPTYISHFNCNEAPHPQGSVSGQLLCPLNTEILPNTPGSATAILAGDTAVLATDSEPAIASQTLQTKSGLKDGE